MEGTLDVASLFGVEAVGPDRFVADSPAYGGSPDLALYGGLLLGQALLAAGATVGAARSPHSVHAAFIRPGRFGAPIEYLVERLRDGRAMDQRTVRGYQDGKLVVDARVVAHAPAPGGGDDWSAVAPPEVPGPDAFEPGPGHFAFAFSGGRFVGHALPAPGRPGLITPAWIRVVPGVRGALAPDPWLRAAALGFWSDMGVTGRARHTLAARNDLFALSIDHALVFHRGEDLDGWFLFDARSRTVAGSQAAVDVYLFDAAGRLVASGMQSVLLRPE